jgi:type II secretory pathway pseudopilin PulG
MVRNGASEQGFALLEAIVSVALVALVLGALLFGAANFGRFGSHPSGTRREAAERLAAQTLRAAQDAWKYPDAGAAGLPAPSGTWSTAMPVRAPGGETIAVPVTIQVTTAIAATAAPNDPTSERARTSVTVTYPPDYSRDDPGVAGVAADLAVKSPYPGEILTVPVAQPSGAP